MKGFQIDALTGLRLFPCGKYPAAIAQCFCLSHRSENLCLHLFGLRFKLADACLKAAVVFKLFVQAHIGPKTVFGRRLWVDEPHILKPPCRRWHSGHDVLVTDWYFRAVDASEKRDALAAPRALRQSKMLFNYTQPPQGLEHAANLADLRAFAQEQLCGQGETMAKAITRHFDGVNFAARVRAMVSWFGREYASELRWAANAARFEAIVARLRADAFGEILANDARQKLYASFSKQLLQQMALFEQMRARAFLPQALSA